MEYDCVLNCGETCDVKDVISVDRWKQLKSKWERWKGLDRFGKVFDTFDWDNGPDGFYMHANCYISLSLKRKFEQSLKRKDQDTTEITSEKSADNDDKESSSATVKRLRSSIDGPVHAKDKCIWCMKGADTKHPDRLN